MVGVKSFERQIENRATGENSTWGKVGQSVPFLMAALKCFILVPLFPMAGYYLLDQTGFSHWLVVQGLIPERILGEGFGHVGLCFSIHYVFTGFRELLRAFCLLTR